MDRLKGSYPCENYLLFGCFDAQMPLFECAALEGSAYSNPERFSVALRIQITPLRFFSPRGRAFRY